MRHFAYGLFNLLTFVALMLTIVALCQPSALPWR